jgi:hypothetical protein
MVKEDLWVDMIPDRINVSPESLRDETTNSLTTKDRRCSDEANICDTNLLVDHHLQVDYYLLLK